MQLTKEPAGSGMIETGTIPVENNVQEQRHKLCQKVQPTQYYESLPVILKDFEHPSALPCLGQWKYIGKPEYQLSGNKNRENDQKLTRTRTGPFRRPRWGLSLSNFEALAYKNDGNSVARILIWELRALDIKVLNRTQSQICKAQVDHECLQWTGKKLILKPWRDQKQRDWGSFHPRLAFTSVLTAKSSFKRVKGVVAGK
jgi:hypothetical protein